MGADTLTRLMWLLLLCRAREVLSSSPSPSSTPTVDAMVSPSPSITLSPSPSSGANSTEFSDWNSTIVATPSYSALASPWVTPSMTSSMTPSMTPSMSPYPASPSPSPSPVPEELPIAADWIPYYNTNITLITQPVVVHEDIILLQSEHYVYGYSAEGLMLWKTDVNESTKLPRDYEIQPTIRNSTVFLLTTRSFCTIDVYSGHVLRTFTPDAAKDFERVYLIGDSALYRFAYSDDFKIYSFITHTTYTTYSSALQLIAHGFNYVAFYDGSVSEYRIRHIDPSTGEVSHVFSDATSSYAKFYFQPNLLLHTAKPGSPAVYRVTVRSLSPTKLGSPIFTYEVVTNPDIHHVSFNAESFAFAAESKIYLFDRTISINPLEQLAYSGLETYGIDRTCNCFWKILDDEVMFMELGTRNLLSHYSRPREAEQSYRTQAVLPASPANGTVGVLYVSVRGPQVWRYPLPAVEFGGAPGNIGVATNIAPPPSSWNTWKSADKATWYTDRACGMQFRLDNSFAFFYDGESYGHDTKAQRTETFYGASNCTVILYRSASSNSRVWFSEASSGTPSAPKEIFYSSYWVYLQSYTESIVVWELSSNQLCIGPLQSKEDYCISNSGRLLKSVETCAYLQRSNGQLYRQCATPADFKENAGLFPQVRDTIYDSINRSLVLVTQTLKIFRLDIDTFFIEEQGSLKELPSRVYVHDGFMILYMNSMLSGFRLPLIAKEPLWVREATINLNQGHDFVQGVLLLSLKSLPVEGSKLVALDYKTGRIEWMMHNSDSFAAVNNRLYATADGFRLGFGLDHFPFPESPTCCKENGAFIQLVCSCMETKLLPWIALSKAVIPVTRELRFSPAAPTRVSLEYFSSMTGLESLSIKGRNRFMASPLQKGPLNLRNLDIHDVGSELADSVTLENILGYLPRLEYLSIAGTHLPSAEVFPMTGLPKLEALILRQSIRKVVLDLALMKFSGSRKFRLHFPGLESLSVSPPANCTQQYGVEELILAHNNLMSFALSSLCSLPLLSQLDLSHNSLSQFFPRDEAEAAVFRSFASLRAINLAGNALMFSEPFPSHWTLEFLNISDNALEELPERFFENLPNLRQVDLSHNSFSSIDAWDLGMESLAWADLRGNPLIHISPSIATFFGRISTLHLPSEEETLANLRPCLSKSGHGSHVYCLGRFAASSQLYCSLVYDGERCGPKGLEWCPAGSFCLNGTVTLCPPNTFSREGYSECVPCPEGSFSIEGSAACLTCSDRQVAVYDNFLGTLSCQACRAGYYFNAAKRACDQCPAGAFCTADSSPKVCPLGRYNENRGSSSCKDCPNGTVGNTECSDSPTCAASVRTACVSCPPGRFSNAVGATQCELCPSGRFSAQSGARNAAECLNCELNAICGAGSTAPFARSRLLQSLKDTLPGPTAAMLAEVPLGGDRPGVRQMVLSDYFDKTVASNEEYDPTVFLILLVAGGAISVFIVVTVLAVFRKRFGAVLRAIDLYAMSHPLRPGESLRSRPSGAGGAFTIGLLAVALTLLGSNLYEYATNNTVITTTLRPSLDLTSVNTELFEFVVNVVVQDSETPAWCENSTLHVTVETQFVDTKAIWLGSNSTSSCKFVASCEGCSVPVSAIFRINIPLDTTYVSWYMHAAGANGDMYGIASVDGLRSQGGVVGGASILLEALPEKIEDRITETNFTGYSINTRLTQYVNPGLRFVQFGQSAEYTFELSISALAKYTEIKKKQTIVELFSAYFGLLLGIMGVFGVLFKAMKRFARVRTTRREALRVAQRSVDPPRLRGSSKIIVGSMSDAQLMNKAWISNPLRSSNSRASQKGSP